MSSKQKAKQQAIERKHRQWQIKTTTTFAENKNDQHKRKCKISSSRYNFNFFVVIDITECEKLHRLCRDDS